MKKLFCLIAFLIIPFLWAEEGIELVEDPSLLEEVYQEFSLRIIQGLRADAGSILVGNLTSNDYPLTASVMFQGVLIKELLVSLPNFEVYESGSFRGDPESINYLVSGETYQEQDVIFISLKMTDNQSGRVLAIHNFTIPANARWGSSFIPQLSSVSPGAVVDSNEPNDTAANARSLNFPASEIIGSFHSSEDIDFYVITIPEEMGEVYVQAETTGSTDTVMTLYGPDDSDSYYSEDDDSGNEYNAKIGFGAMGGQTWWIALRAYDDGGSYSLNIDATDEMLSSDEANNSFMESFPMNIGDELTGYYSYNDEGDYFYLDITQDMLGKLVKIYTDDMIDTELYIYDSVGIESGDYLYYNDDAQTYAAEVSFIPSDEGRYYIMLTAYDEGPYALYSEVVDIPTDGTEPNDSFSMATEIAPGDQLEQSFFHEMDLDYFVLKIDELRRYRIETLGDIDPYITVYDENMEYLDSDDDSGENTNALLRTFFEPGTYYLELKSAVSDSLGDYTLIVE